MKIILDMEELRQAVEMYVRMTMSIEYKAADVRFPHDNCEWDGTAVIGELEDEEPRALEDLVP